MKSISFRSIKMRLLYAICSPLTYIMLKIKKVQLEGALKSCGFAKFHKGNNSSIKIGKDFKLLNLSWMNLLGLNHCCMLSTEDKAFLSIGDNVGMSGTTIWCFDKIVIEDNVRIGANCIITDGDAHPKDPRSGSYRPVHICKNVWLGMNVIVLKGVTIGENSVIGAGSIVTKDIPANVVAAGNPCKVIKPLDDNTIQKTIQYFNV